MKKVITSFALGAAFLLGASVAQAGGHQSWTLQPEDSTVAFGSVKLDTVGEVHHFSSIAGEIGEDGSVSVEIDVASVQTNIDIRNERMLEWVFNNGPKAILSAQLDMGDILSLGVGESRTVDVAGSLTLNGNTIEIVADFFVVRMSEKSLLVTTADMIMLSVEQAGLTPGVDKLMELAGLPGITRVSPVTMRLVFSTGTH